MQRSKYMVCHETIMKKLPKNCFECVRDCNSDKQDGRPKGTCTLFVRPDINEARKILQQCCDDKTLDFDQALRKLGYTENSP